MYPGVLPHKNGWQIDDLPAIAYSDGLFLETAERKTNIIRVNFRTGTAFQQ